MDYQTYMTSNKRFIAIWLLHLPCCISWVAEAQAQDDPMRVERITVIDQSKPVYNIYVDQDNHKWIANSTTVYFVEAKDMAEPLEIPPSEQSLLQLPGGNHDVRWDRKEIKGILGEAKVTCAAYDKRTRNLWIGSDGYGVFRLRVEGGLQLLEQMHIDNSRLRSDFINAIYISPAGKIWIATEDGALLGENGNWKVFQKYFNIQTIAGDRNETWAIGDGLVWIIDRKDNWTPIEINKREIEGSMHDIALDQEGKIWIASNIMTSYHIASQRYQHFGPGQYFTSQFVNYVSVDHDGTIWVGTDDKGVYIIEKESTITLTTNLDDPVDCVSGDLTASISARAIGGVEPYTFTWSHGSTGSHQRGVGPGTYTVTVTDTEGASKSASITVNDPTIAVEGIMRQGESGPGASDGVATFVASGGTPAYTCRWNTGATSLVLDELTAGTYSVTVTDIGGCTGTASVTITTNVSPLEVSLEETAAIQCHGASTGAVSAVVEGGMPPYAFTWNASSINESSAIDIPAGNYSVTVTDARGETASAALDLEEPPAIHVRITASQAATVSNEDGRATAVPDGSAVAGYKYLWTNGETAQTAVQLGAGRHTVTVTDANGCTATASVEISERIQPLRVEIAQTQDILCAKQQTAQLAVSVSGGKEPYAFAWKPTSVQGNNPADLGAGLYTVTVTDAAGNSASDNIAIKEPTSLSVSIYVEAPATAGMTNGRVRADVEGGTGPYSFRWENGETTGLVTGVAAGEHSVTVTDAAGCTASVNVIVAEEILPLNLVLSRTEEEILCHGDATATIVSNVEGGKAPFEYTWSDPAIQGRTARGVSAGTYNATVTDAEGNTASASITIDQPERMLVNAEVVRAASTNSTDGIARASATGGLGEYTFRWSTEAMESEAHDLAPGVHTVTVTDVVGCTASTSVTITEDIQPLEITLSQNAEIECHGASTGGLAVDVSGGKAPFTYAWSSAVGAESSINGLPAGTYSVTVTDAVGSTKASEVTISGPRPIDMEVRVRRAADAHQNNGEAVVRASGGTGGFTFLWDHGESDATASQLAAGVHVLTVTDEAGCSATATVSITEDIPPLSVSIAQTAEIQCNGDATASLEVELEGGKAPYTYQWNTGRHAEAMLDSVPAGVYSATVTDVAGNSATASYTVDQPDPLSARTTVKSPASTNSANGSAMVNATGGSGSYAYAWDNGETNSTAEELAPGVHTVTVTDAGGCSVVADVEIAENILPLSASITQTVEIQCSGDSGAALEIHVQGGKGPFEYLWSIDQKEGRQIENLRAGEYTVTVTDVTGSSTTAFIAVSQPEALIVNATVKSPASTNSADGSAAVTASGGSGAYTYTWDTGETQNTAEELAPGVHSVTVTDAAGCSAVASVEIEENVLPLSVSVSQEEEIHCAGETTATVIAHISGGKGPFTYTWSNGSAGEMLTNAGSGELAVTVTDATNQQATAAVSIDEPTPLQVEITDRTPAGTGARDGKARISATGGRQPYRYIWDNGETADLAETLSPGIHTVTVEDANGCQVTATADIPENILDLQVSIAESVDIRCAGGQNGTLTASISGGKRPYAISWSNGQATAEISGLSAGLYAVTATDASGQSAEAQYRIEAPPPLSCSLKNVRAAAAEHVPDGKATADVTGGTPPYTYTWDNGETTQHATKLGIGAHAVTVSDAHGCETVLTFEITQKILPELTAETLESGRAVRMEQLQFEADSTAISDESIPTLNELYQFLYDNPTIVVEIGGHTNGLPEHEYCDRLSTARAKAVAEYIVQMGIESKRVYYKGYGKRKPIATNRTPEGRKRNQRVEVRILRLADVE